MIFLVNLQLLLSGNNPVFKQLVKKAQYPMSNIIVRAALQADLPILKEFEQGIIATERPLNDCLKSEHICYYDIGALIDGENSKVIVAEENGVIVGSGYARIRESKAHLTHDLHAYLGFMYVASTHRGQGINQLIIQTLINWGKARGMQDFYLEAYADNSSALKAYEKLGFKASLVEMKLSL